MKAPAKQTRRAKNGHSPKADVEDPTRWNLRLYVAGQTPRSLTAFNNLKKICEAHLKGQYHIEVVDLMERLRRSLGHLEVVLGQRALITRGHSAIGPRRRVE
jgi:hypothetical protein